jgi:GxxExxY protein
MVEHAESSKGYNFKDIANQIIGTAIEVHKELGPGFQEVTYQRALAMEFQAVGMDFAREEKVSIFYKGKHIDTRRVDFVVEDCILEIKARKELLPEDNIQTLCYLKASRYRIALLLNFGSDKLEIKRFINERGRYAHTVED